MNLVCSRIKMKQKKWSKSATPFCKSNQRENANWLIIKSKTAWLQKNIHFLLTRKNNIALDDVGNLLKKLKDFTINRYLYRKNFYYKIKIFLKDLFI